MKKKWSPTRKLFAVLAVLLALPAAAVLGTNTYWLVDDYLQVVATAESDATTLEALEEASRDDAERVAELEAERERQTQAKQDLAARQKLRGYLVAASAAVFLIAVKWLLSQRSPSTPRLEVLRRERTAEAQAHSGRGQRGKVKKRSRAKPRGETEDATTGQPSPADLAAVDEIVARHGGGADAAIPVLQAIQAHYRYLPPAALERACEITELTPAQVAGVSSFYAGFRRTPVGRYLVRVCHGTACHVCRAPEIDEEIRRHLELPADGDTDAARQFTVERVACLGCCSLAPVIMIEEETFGNLTPSETRDVIDGYRDNGANNGRAP